MVLTFKLKNATPSNTPMIFCLLNPHILRQLTKVWWKFKHTIWKLSSNLWVYESKISEFWHEVNTMHILKNEL
jgi:hypothetical protein